MAEEQQALQRYEAFRQELAPIGVSEKFTHSLVSRGWTLPMVREAKALVTAHHAAFHHIARLRREGTPFPLINALFILREDHPWLTIPAVLRVWLLCIHGRITEADVTFFRSFLDAAEGLFDEALNRMKSGVGKSPSFILGRLLEYVAVVDGDVERVFRELLDDPDTLLDRILASSERSLEHGDQERVRVGRDPAWQRDEDDEDQVNLLDLHDRFEGREND